MKFHSANSVIAFQRLFVGSVRQTRLHCFAPECSPLIHANVKVPVRSPWSEDNKLIDFVSVLLISAIKSLSVQLEVGSQTMCSQRKHADCGLYDCCLGRTIKHFVD